MIMPCMNSTSAWERGGRLARVERGSVLLGCPGAPGWTITGGAAAEDEGGEGADCWAFIEDGEKINMEVLAANSRPFLRQDFRQVVVYRFDINWSSRLTLRMPEYLELPIDSIVAFLPFVNAAIRTKVRQCYPSFSALILRVRNGSDRIPYKREIGVVPNSKARRPKSYVWESPIITNRRER